MNRYKLGDLTLKSFNSWDRVPRMPEVFIAAVGAIAPALAGTTAATVIGYVAYTAVTSWALQALAPKPDFGTGSSAGLLVNSKDVSAPHDFVYGEIRKGGVVTFYESTGTDNKYLHQVIVLAGHELNSIGDIYINDQIASIDANGFVSVAGTGDEQVNYNSKIRIKKHDGSQTTADSDLVSETSVDSNFVGNGIAYLYVRYEYDQDVFPNGLPLITAKVQGKKVYDPRSASTAYSNNAALCIRDFIASSYGLNDSSIDDTSFQAAANECDESVTLSGGGSENRYTINGVVRADRSVGDVLQSMTTACAGTLFWGAGAWKLKAGAYSSPVKTLTLDDLRGPISLDTRITMRDNFNTVSGTFIDANQDYITADYPQITSAAFKAEDGGEEVKLDLTLPYTTSAATAQRLAKLTLFRGREQMTLSADFGLEAFEIEVGDIIAFTNARYGFSAKEFEVIGWRLAANQDAGDLRINLTLRETSSAAFDWNAEETAIISNNTTLPQFRTVAAPTSLSLTATAVINDDGITIPAIRADWTAAVNAFVHHYEVQFKRLGGSEDYGLVNTTYTEQENWGSIADALDETSEDYGLTNEEILDADAEFVSAFTTTTSFLIQPVLNGYDYQVKVRAVSALDVRSTFVTATLASEGDTDPPNEPLSLAAVAGSKYIELSWTNPADQDLSHIEIWENTTNNLATASLIGSSGSSNFFRGNLANNVTRYYWARAVDLSLNKSDFTSSVNATTLLITPNDFNDAVNDLFQEAGAFGIEPVSSLPASGDFDGQLVLLLPDITIYRWDDATSSWSTDIYTASQVEAGSIGFASFASGIEPVGVVSSLPTVSGYTGPQVVILTTDGKIYRLVSGAWTTAVSTLDLSGTLPEDIFSDDLRPIERVSALPTTNLTQGRVVLLTTDNKLYRYTGNAWTAAVPTTDLTGQIASGQIADAAITATKIGNDAVTTAKIAVGAITSTELGVDAVTSAKIANSAITAAKIGNDAVTSAKIANDAVTADVIAAGAITETKIAADAVTTAKIAANAITASEIAAGAITSNEIAANTITAGEIAAGAVTASEIAAGAVTTGKLAAGAVTANEIAADAITTEKIAAGAVTAAEITAGAITTAKIAAGAVTAAEIAAGAVVAGKIAANAVTATEIAANTITSSEIAAGAITANEIAANTITAGKIATNTITANEIAANTITASQLAANTITANEIAADTITANELAANSVGTSELIADSVTAGIIAAGAVSTSELAADAVTAEKIAAGAVVAESIAANAITSAKIGTDQVTANKIAASSIITSKIATGAVTAAKISVSELSAISADLGTISVDSAHIDDAAITSAKIADTIQSDNYSAGSAGWRIKKDGSAEFNGVVISRQLQVDSGSYSAGNIGGTTNDDPTEVTPFYIQTNINVSAWAGTNKTYLVAIGNSGSVTALTSDVTNNPTTVRWGFRGDIVPLTQWSGTAKLWIKVTPTISNVVSTNLTLSWKVYEVT